MKKNLTILIAGLLLSLNLPAQGFLNTLNKAINGLGQRGQQMNNQRNNNQRTYQNYQRNDSQERLYQQRRETLQRSNYQRKNNDTEIVKPSNSVSLSNVSNQAQENDKVVTLVTSGTGNTKEEAIRNALRSAIEQAFGTFVSANTEVLNDDLIKDEVTTVSTGNIRSYKELSVNQSNGTYDVSVQAIVSIDQLTNYAKSKGFQVELAGEVFVMNMKMRELNKQNELSAINHLIKKLKIIGNNGGLFNYELEKSEPILFGNSQYGVKLKLLLYGNGNTKIFYDEIYNTIGALSLSQSELKEYKEVGLKYYVYDMQLTKNEEHYKDERRLFFLRNEYRNVYSYGEIEASWLLPILIEQALQFVIYDNLGNQYYCSNDNVENKNVVWLSSSSYGGFGTLKFFYFAPTKQIAGVKGKEMKGRDCDYIAETPLVDYIKSDEHRRYDKHSIVRTLHFNPLLDYCENDYYAWQRDYSKEIRDNIQERNRSNCYFQLEFFVLYSEDELFKLQNISVKNQEKIFDDKIDSGLWNEDNNIQNRPNAQNEKSHESQEILLEKNNQQTDYDRVAEFPGGECEMLKYLKESLRYPAVAEENGIQGLVKVQFDIDRDGRIVDAKVVKSIDASLDKEALRLVQRMPRWSPAIKDGVAVRSHRVISIPFRLQ